MELWKFFDITHREHVFSLLVFLINLEMKAKMKLFLL